MLSDTTNVAAHRPRPPGQRRSSANPPTQRQRSTKESELDDLKGASAVDGIYDHLQAQKAELVPPQSVELHSDKSSKSTSRRQSNSSLSEEDVRYEQDLGLDLPHHLTAALERSRRAPGETVGGSLRSRPRIGSAGAKKLDSLFDGTPSSPAQVCEKALRMPNTEEEHDERVKTAGEGGRMYAAAAAADDSDNASEKSLDRDWVGGLPREELEALLVEANKVIKARERDLGIAAAIGKALLEKNVSLRNKHEGILSRFSTSASLANMLPSNLTYGSSFIMAGEGPANSPPTSDIHIAAEDTDLGHNHLDDETPRPTPQLNGDYFAHNSSTQYDPFLDSKSQQQQQQQPRSALRNAHSRDSSNSSSYYPIANATPLSAASPPSYWQSDTAAAPRWPSNKSEYFVPSGPPSPSVSRVGGSRKQSFESLARAQAHEDAQRQLDALSQQNDALLDQLAQLQTEAEEAKKQGGRKLKKLTREIEGLKGELEAATERNVELELGTLAQTEGLKVTPPKIWTRRGSDVVYSSSHGEQEEDEDDSATSGLQRKTSLQKADRATQRSSLEESVARASDALSIRSVSSVASHLGASTRPRKNSEGERALVAQLLAKIQELEETNASLTLAGTEMDGRIGRAIEEGERIRDAYEAVETANSTDSMFQPACLPKSYSSGLDVGGSPLQMSPMSSSSMSNASPTTMARRARRRAPGNRYIIEGRRTIRDALRQTVEDDDDDDDNHLSDDVNSSPTHSRGQRHHHALRPRILITPSTEDLAARRKQDEEERQGGWVDEDIHPRLQAPIRRSRRKSANTVRRVLSEASFASPQKKHTDGRPVGSTPPRKARHSRESSLGSQVGMLHFDSQTSLVPWQGQRTLQSELVGTFGGSTGDVNAQSSATVQQRIRLRRSTSSLRAASEPESDIADLKWSVSSGDTVVDKTRQNSPARRPQQQQQRIAAEAYDGSGGDEEEEEGTTTVMRLADGEWLDPDESLVFRGGLRDQRETTGDSYDELESATRKVPLHWADDDDFGKPITEREARRLGLMPKKEAPSLLGSRKGSMLLGWVSKAKSKMPRGTAKEAAPLRQIESSEAVAERLRMQALLREKRVAALQARLVAGQMTPARAYAMGLTDEEGRLLKPFSSSVTADDSVESEATMRALAMSSVRHRRRTLSKPPSPQANLKGKQRAGVTEEGSGNGGGPSSSSDEAFEMLELDQARRKRGKRGTDYYPVSYTARYRPAVVKQRVQQASVEAVTWASAWATFSLVMVFAFLVAFSVGC